MPRQHLEQRRRHTWLIHAGDGDQHRHLGWCVHPRAAAVRHGRRLGSVDVPIPVAPLSAVGAPDVRFGAKPFHHVRIVQLERRTLRTDPGQLGEVVPRRRATGRPLQRIAVAPRVVDGHHLAVAPALEDVPHEREHRRTQDERPDRRDDVVRLEAVGGQVVGVAARHAHVAQPVLHQERGVKADERQPEVQLAQPLVEQPAGHLREPEVDAGEGGEHDGAEQHVVEVRDDEIAVGHVEVQRRAGQQHAGQTTQQEGDQEARPRTASASQRSTGPSTSCRSS